MSLSVSPTPIFISPLTPINCIGPAFEFIGSDIYILNIGLGIFSLLKSLLDVLTGAAAPPINAVGYHSAQNYLYGISYTSVPQVIVRFGAGGTSEIAGPNAVIPSTTTTQPLLIGDIDGQQQYWLGYNDGAGWVQVDLNAASETYLEVVGSGAATNLRFAVGDWAYVPGYPTRLWALGQEIVTDALTGLLASYNTHLVYFDTVTHAWIDVFTFYNTAGGLLLGQAQWGAVYSANDGNIYATESNTGQTWRFPLTPVTGSIATLVAVGAAPLGRAIDGARCPLNNNLAAS